VALANADCSLPTMTLTIPAGQAAAHCCLGLDGHADISFGMSAQSAYGDQFSLSVSAQVDTGTGVCGVAPYWLTYGPWNVSCGCFLFPVSCHLFFVNLCSDHSCSLARITSPTQVATSLPRLVAYTLNSKSSSSSPALSLPMVKTASSMSLKRCATALSARWVAMQPPFRSPPLPLPSHRLLPPRFKSPVAACPLLGWRLGGLWRCLIDS
jgi:hypothetical protein